MKKIMMIMAILTGIFSQIAMADIPGTINYQGRLTDGSGNAVADGTYGVTFTLYYQATGNTPTGWSEVQNINTQGGYFDMALGSQTSMSSLSFDYPYYLEVHVAGDSRPMSPRQQLQSVPYAMRAKDGTPKGAIIMWTGATCPVGYRRLTELDGLFPRGAASYSGGHAGGADSHSHGGNTTSPGSHSHGVNITSQNNIGYVNIPRGSGSNMQAAGQYHTHVVSGSTNVDGAHNHSIVTGTVSNVPRYFNVIFCLKE
ncbi:hypothetical protein KAR34_01915 [bacterium]|nr:hypothetical protein [bacterium]